MSAACIFVGPTLARGAVQAVLSARCLPPVAQGDLVRAVRDSRPRAIGIIDGFFGGAPSVWHKEILWAMDQGIAVFGAASMGALRAAELHVFGMRGIGRIFDAYRDGTLEDDDEVAVVHAPAEMGFAALSEPMVNIRATLAAAELEGIVTEAARRALETTAKALHFPERSWPALLERSGAHGMTAAETDRFGAWLPTGRVDLKRDDALAMLDAMGVFLKDGRPAVVTSPLEMTHFLAAALAAEPASLPADDATAALVLDEFRLGSRAVFDAITAKALLRFASERDGSRQDGPGEDAVARQLEAIRAGRGLFSQSHLTAWLSANDLDPASFERLAAGAWRADRLSQSARPSLAPHLLDELKLAGAYPELAQRARRKQARLAADGADAAPQPTRPERLALRLWFGDRLGLPEEAGLDAILTASGFADASTLDRVLHRERLYLTLMQPVLEGGDGAPPDGGLEADR